MCLNGYFVNFVISFIPVFDVNSVTIKRVTKLQNHRPEIYLKIFSKFFKNYEKYEKNPVSNINI